MTYAIVINLGEEEKHIEFTRINNDVNGNPRYVCHFLNFIKDGEFDNLGTVNKDGSVFTADDVIRLVYGMSMTSYKYMIACKRAHKIGGRKYHTKSYGGGIVFQSYNIRETEKDILRVMAEVEQEQEELENQLREEDEFPF